MLRHRNLAICLIWCSYRTMQIREKEADIDTLINPIEDMYALLLRYEVRLTSAGDVLPTTVLHRACPEERDIPGQDFDLALVVTSWQMSPCVRCSVHRSHDIYT